ncbi:MAG: hypothetical protein QUU85_04560, partial [Candidatus Eisenbacteria bacterium]|nr:hypothetical protein [Candidatus Eisenbacteria bacterium]
MDPAPLRIAAWIVRITGQYHGCQGWPRGGGATIGGALGRESGAVQRAGPAIGRAGIVGRSEVGAVSYTHLR